MNLHIPIWEPVGEEGKFRGIAKFTEGILLKEIPKIV